MRKIFVMRYDFVVVSSQIWVLQLVNLDVIV